MSYFGWLTPAFVLGCLCHNSRLVGCRLWIRCPLRFRSGNCTALLLVFSCCSAAPLLPSSAKILLVSHYYMPFSSPINICISSNSFDCFLINTELPQTTFFHHHFKGMPALPNSIYQNIPGLLTDPCRRSSLEKSRLRSTVQNWNF